MSLIGASRTMTNQTMRARVEAAVRQTASAKTADASPSGRLATQALIDPSSAAPHFLARLAVNPTVANLACVDCGYSAVEDNDITYVVTQAWDDVAAIIFPDVIA